MTLAPGVFRVIFMGPTGVSSGALTFDPQDEKRNSNIRTKLGGVEKLSQEPGNISPGATNLKTFGRVKRPPLACVYLSF